MTTDIALYKKQLAEAAEAYAGEEKLGGGSFLTTRGGVFKIGEEEMPGNQVCVIILDSIRENTLYAERFNADEMAQPLCYAFGRTDAEMAPHISMADFPDVFAPQNDECKGCAFAEWGSSDTGKGKACQNRRRLAVIPAGVFEPVKGTKGDYDVMVFEDAEHYQNADIAFLKLPVTSVEKYSRFVNDVAKEHQLPPFGVIARIWLTPDSKKQYVVNFEVLDVLPDELIPAIMGRHEEAKERIVTPYKPFEEREEAPSKGKQGLKGLKRPGA